MIHTQSYNQVIMESLLIHFISLSSFLALEYVTDMILFWFPFYSSLKLLFVLWLSIPFFGGSRIFYLDHIQPFLDQHERQLDVSILKIKSLFQNEVDKSKTKFALNLQSSIVEWVSYGYSYSIKLFKSKEKEESPTRSLPPLVKKKNSFPRKRISTISEKKSSPNSLKSISPQKTISPHRSRDTSPDRRNSSPQSSRSSFLYVNKTEFEGIEDVTLEDYYESDFDQ